MENRYGPSAQIFEIILFCRIFNCESSVAINCSSVCNLVDTHIRSFISQGNWQVANLSQFWINFPFLEEMGLRCFRTDTAQGARDRGQSID